MSKLEEDFHRQIMADGLDEGMMREYRFHPTRRWRFDFAWPKIKVAVEVQGGIWIGGKHSRGMGLLNDYEKGREAAAIGWRILYITGREINNGAALDALHRTLAYTDLGQAGT